MDSVAETRNSRLGPALCHPLGFQVQARRSLPVIQGPTGGGGEGGEKL